MGKRNRAQRDILEDLENQGRALEAVLLAWSIVEMHSTNVVLRVYGLSTRNPKSDPLINQPVAEKLRLLKRLRILSDDEYTIVEEFRLERNNLFHTGGLFFPNYTEEKKRKLIDLAIAAADAAHNLSERVLSFPSPVESHLEG